MNKYFYSVFVCWWCDAGKRSHLRKTFNIRFFSIGMKDLHYAMDFFFFVRFCFFACKCH